MNLREIKIYISGPLSGNIERNIKHAIQVRDKIHGLGFTPVCPHIMFSTPKTKKQYQENLKSCIALVPHCNGILMFGEWWKSEGSKDEWDEAEKWRIPIFDELNDFDQLLKYDWTQTRRYKLDYIEKIFEKALVDLGALMLSGDGKGKHGDRGSWNRPTNENLHHLRNHITRLEKNEMIDNDSGFNVLLCIMSRAGIIYDQTK